MVTGRAELLAGPAGPLEWRMVGTGAPCTVVAHGLAASIASTRPFLSGVPGRKAFFHFRGHGESACPDPFGSYADLAQEVRAVADVSEATQAVGVSMGAGAVCALLQEEPDRFSRVVLLLPAVSYGTGEPTPTGASAPTGARTRTREAGAGWGRLADAVAAGDVDAAARLLVTEQTGWGQAGGDVLRWARAHAAWLIASGDGIVRALRTVPAQPAAATRAGLNAVTAPVLVIAQEGDDVHPVDAASELAQAFSDARLEVLPSGGLLGRHRDRLRAIVGSFLPG